MMSSIYKLTETRETLKFNLKQKITKDQRWHFHYFIHQLYINILYIIFIYMQYNQIESNPSDEFLNKWVKKKIFYS